MMQQCLSAVTAVMVVSVVVSRNPIHYTWETNPADPSLQHLVPDFTPLYRSQLLQTGERRDWPYCVELFGPEATLPTLHDQTTLLMYKTWMEAFK